MTKQQRHIAELEARLAALTVELSMERQTLDAFKAAHEAERERYANQHYVKFEEYERDSSVVGRFWTQAELDRVGGCGVKTTMGQALAETYARQPDFYGKTYCAGCQDYFPVGAAGEFVWDGTDEKVGT